MPDTLGVRGEGLARWLIARSGRGAFGRRFSGLDTPHIAADLNSQTTAAWEYENRDEFFMIFRARTAADLVGKEVLDLGCGHGGRTVFYAEQGAVVTGLEPHEPAVDVGRRFAGEQGVDVRFVVGRGEQMPFPDGSFDTVISFDVLEHVQEPRRVVAEIARVLRPGGEAWLIFPSYLGARASHLDPLTRLPGLHRIFAPDVLASAANNCYGARGIETTLTAARGPCGRMTVSDLLNGMSVADTRAALAETGMEWVLTLEPIIEPRTRLPGGRFASRTLSLFGGRLPDLFVGRIIALGRRS